MAGQITVLPRHLTSMAAEDSFTVAPERERKFLVAQLPRDLSSYQHEELRQAYVKDGASGEWVRAREVDGGREYILTIKVTKDDYERIEGERPITKKEFELILALSEGRALEKTRYYIPHSGRTFELDAYHGKLEGMYTVEVEFPTMKELHEFSPPAWFGAEVSSDRRYRNKKLARNGVPEGYSGPEVLLRK